MMILDSSVWVAFYNEADSQHAKAIRLSASFSDIALPEYILLETSTLLRSKAGDEIAERFLKYSLENAEVSVLYSSRELLHETALLFRRMKNTKLSFVDVALLHLSRTHEVITFDTALEKAIRRQKL
ncbi:MAG: PIN domain-containing protein [Patescibacteria group bacterium]